MAAIDRFEYFNESLPNREKQILEPLIHEQRHELLAARSEDARIRLVHEYIRQAHEILQFASQKTRH